MPTNDRPVRSASEFDDPTIPVLTERLTLPPLDLDFTLPPRGVPAAYPAQPPAPPAAAPQQPPRALQAAAPDMPASAAAVAGAGRGAATVPTATPTALALDQIERELREAILHDLSVSLPQTVESIVREKMQPGIQSALDRLAIETRVALAASLREIIERAVRAHLDALRKRGR
jgi:hypothetical protein